MHSRDTVTSPLDLGNPHELTIAELAQKVIGRTGSKPKIIFKPLPQDDPRQRRPRSSRARQLLGWRPRVALDEGLDRAVAWFEQASQVAG